MTYFEAVLTEQAFWLLDIVDDKFFWENLDDVQAMQEFTGRGPGKPYHRKFSGVIH